MDFVRLKNGNTLTYLLIPTKGSSLSPIFMFWLTVHIFFFFDLY